MVRLDMILDILGQSHSLGIILEKNISIRYFVSKRFIKCSGKLNGLNEINLSTQVDRGHTSGMVSNFGKR